VRQIYERKKPKAKELLTSVINQNQSPFLVWEAHSELAHLFGQTDFNPNQVQETFVTFFFLFSFFFFFSFSFSFIQAAFEMALASCKEMVSKEQGKVLDRLKEFGGLAFSLRGGGYVDVVKKLSPSELVKLREVIALFPLLGNSIIRPFQGQRQLYLEIIQDLLSKNFHEALSFIPFLSGSNMTSKDSRLLDALLENLFSAENPFLVYQALLGTEDRETLIDRYGVLEDAKIKMDYREPVPSIFETASAEKFWPQLHSLTVASAKHFFEVVLEKALVAAQHERDEECALLLRHFPKLRALVIAIILTRSQIRGAYDVQKSLLDALYGTDLPKVREEDEAVVGNGEGDKPSENQSNKLDDFVASIAWRVSAAHWCSQQECLEMTADAVLEKLETLSLLDVVGEQLDRIDRAGMLELLESNHQRKDWLLCIEYFIMQDVQRALKADEGAALEELQKDISANLDRIEDADSWKRVSKSCLNILYNSSSCSIEVFGCVLGAIRSSRTGQENGEGEEGEEEELIVEAEFRLAAANTLKSKNPLFDSGAQILSDATMAGEWELGRSTIKHFKLVEDENCQEVVTFARKEEEMGLNREKFAAQSGDALALADLAFAELDPEKSAALLEKAIEATNGRVALHDFFSNLLILARGYHVALRDVFRISREFPQQQEELRDFVASENRIQAIVASMTLENLTETLQNLNKEFARLSPQQDQKVGEEATPLCKFLQYLQFLKQIEAGSDPDSLDALMVQSPEDLVSYLIASKMDEPAAESLCSILGIKIVDALVSRTEPVSLRELEYIARTEPNLAASVALQRQGDVYDAKILEFAETCLESVDSQNKERNAHLRKIISSCRLFAIAYNIDRPIVDNDDDREQVWKLLLEGESAAYHEKIVDRLVLERKYEQALAVADEYLPDGPKDDLLIEMAKKGGPDCWKYLVRISDRNVGAELGISLLSFLELDHAIDVLEMCVMSDRFNVASEASAKLKLLHAYEPVLRRKNVFGPWKNWQELDSACRENSEAVVKQMSEWKQFELAKVITQCFDGPSSTQSSLNIDADALIHLLEHGSDAESVASFVESLADPVATVNTALSVVKVPESRMILWGYLAKRVGSPEHKKSLLGAQVLSLLSADTALETGGNNGADVQVRSVSRARRGLFASSDSPMKMGLRQMLFHLESNPPAIVESLMMNERVSEVATIFHTLPELINDELIMSYARKALAFDTLRSDHSRKKSSTAVESGAAEEDGKLSQSAEGREDNGGGEEEGLKKTPAKSPSTARSLSSTPESNKSSGNALDSNLPSSAALVWVLRGLDPVKDMALRRRHSFKSAPSINLSTALLDLCSGARVAARACLDISLHLTSLLATSPSSSHLLLVNLVKQLLFYAKLQFTKQTSQGERRKVEQNAMFTVDDGGGAEGGVAVCQTFLAHIDLLHDLFMDDCDIHCSLEELGDPRKARIIRDKLIEQDRMALATAVSTKCAIETEPVWMAWGLRLLRLGDYEAAKEKLNKCVETERGGNNAKFDRSVMLTQILEILQSGSDDKLGDTMLLREELHEMEDALKASGDADNFVYSPDVPSVEGKPQLDTVRYMQCVYYLSRFGSTTQLIRFWLENGFLEDACRYIIGGGLPESVFISEVLTHCLSFDCMRDLFACLPRVDSKGTKKVKYLVQACKYLNEAHAFDLLLEMQEFMQDWCRAGLTCVKLFHIESTHDIRYQYLIMAEKHFSNAIKEAQQFRLKKASTSSLALMMDSNADALVAPENADDFNQNNMPLSETEISKYFRKVVLQKSIMEFLQERPNIAEMEELRKLSMFGSSKDKIAERLVVLAPSSDLGFRMMQEFRLPQGEIYSRAVRELVLSKRKSELTALLKTIKGAIDHEEWDMVLLAIIKTYSQDMKDASSGEKYISKIFNAKSQVVAYRYVNLLKTAYVLACKLSDSGQVEEIRTAALETNSKTVIQLCNAYLAKNPATPK
jgi:zinc finger FYVE domain-containing protein 26